MQVSGVGTAVMLAVAAILWFAYLVPTWVRRREYLATERNATRLQQTLRIMAETAETPDAVHVEATARSVARQERLLRQRERQLRARDRAALAATKRARARSMADRSATVHTTRMRRARVRRGRLCATTLLLLALALGGLQSWLVVVSGAVPGSWLVLGAASVGVVAALAALRTLSRRRVPAPATLVSPAVRHVAPEAEAPAPSREWTPVPVPRPRYLNTPVQQPVAPAADAERLLREASEQARSALRAAHRDAEVVDFPVPVPTAERAASAPVPSRWDAMGVVDGLTSSAPDLDEVLRRRRAAG